MHPIFFQIGPLTVYTYGFMLAVAVFVCSFLLQKEFERNHLPGDIVFDLIFWIVLAGIAGCRIFFILLNWDYFVQNPAEIVMLQHGGLAWQGGLIAGSIAGLVLIRKRKLPLLKTLDILAPYAALGQSIGRVGCLLNGCCYGQPVSWGLFFPVYQTRLHPTQLYESVGLLVIFLILKQAQERPRFQGEIFIFYLWLASILRFSVEFFRADHELIFGFLSIFQIMTVFFLGVAAYAYLQLESRRRA